MRDLKIGLALSGGGVRAATYHLGVLRCLKEKQLLGNVHYVSTVSGGSLLTGLLFHLSKNQWPTDEIFSDVHQKIKTLLTKKNLQSDFIVRLFCYPWNWRFLSSGANVVSQSIQEYWEIDSKLGDLPQKPVWSINGTSVETGKRWRFKNNTMGDYEIGYASLSDFKIADAMAVSAAFPGGITPYRINTNDFKWLKRKNWDDPDPVPYKPKFHQLHLADGGLYDNLGIEPFFDHSKGALKSKSGINWLIVSDAGSRLKSENRAPSFRFLKRLLRMTDIISDQVRSLRIRNISNSFITQGNGILLGIGENGSGIITRAKKKYHRVIPHDLRNYDWLEPSQCIEAGNYKTTLKRMSESDFDLIERCGYEVTLANLGVYASDITTTRSEISTTNVRPNVEIIPAE
ncbi:MAG: patatin-like phospholipase family protein [Desulfobacteraceae bacterium]|nr:patatin-like phospholipase family protein [Desulfobacteraceae bacterium]